MKTSTKVAGVLAVSAGIMLSAQPAFADSFIDPATKAVESGQVVYADSGAPITSEGAIQSGLKGTDVHVVSLPVEALSTYTATDIASQITAKSGTTTVVVVVDGSSTDSIGVAGAHSAEISKVLYKALPASNGDAGQAIASSTQEIVAINAGSPAVGGHAADGGGVSIGLVLVPIILLVAAGVAGVGYMVRRRRNHNVITTLKSDVPTNFSDLMPASLIPLMKQMSDLMRKHNKLQHGSLSTDLRVIMDNLQELFKRLNKKGTTGQAQIAEIEYADKLPKLIEALGSDYYVDIIEREDLWDNTAERLEAVTVAVKAVETQLVQNIRQVNASKDLEFQVALGSLTRGSNPTSISDIYKNNNSEKE